MKTSATKPSTAIPNTHRPQDTIRRAVSHGRMVRRGTFLLVVAALVCFVIPALAPAAAPVYGEWSAPVNLGPIVNSPVVPGSTGRDTGPALSADGLSLYFDSDRPGGSGGRDLWVSQRATVSGAWGVPVNLGPTINSPLVDSVPAFSSDGHWMFFVSNRSGGFGGNDIYQSFRPDAHDDLGWQAPTNLGQNVNTAAGDNGASYFENEGGAPQLMFGSDRLVAGNADWYMSERHADGSWGLATSIPELNSVFNEGRPTVRRDGLEIFFHRGIALGLSSTDLWVATRASVDDPWSAPVNVGATVNGSFTDQDAYLSADGRTLFFDSNRPGGSGGFELYMSTRDAKLTVTGNDQSRLFGQPNPQLTSTITGFVGGDTSAVVSGAAVCTTTATPTSPGGDYPITCMVGTLGAAGYSFATFVDGTLTVTYTNSCLIAPRTGTLTVSAGQAVCIGAGGVQTGPVTVNAGGSLDVEGGRITGPLNANGAAAVRICGTTITGPLTISGTTDLVLVGGDAATGPCDLNTITGRVRVTDNGGGVEFNGNTVVGPLTITGNTGSLPAPDSGPVHAAGNAVTGPDEIQS
jgi:hypothetical protein